MNYNDAMTKVKKLLEMTTDNGCTEAEAANAAGMAQKLMVRYRIESIDLDTNEEEDEEVRNWEDPLDEMPKTKKQTWRGQLAMVVCRNNGCTTFWSHGRNGKPVLGIVGRSSDVMTTRYLYQFCAREIQRLRKQYKGNGATWLNNWRMGVIDGISDSLKEAREAARQEYSAETGTALVVVDRALAVIDDHHRDALAYAKAKLGLRGGGRASSRTDYGARETGKRDGRNINVNGAKGQLGSSARRLK